MATTPPTGRYVLVNGCDAWIEHDGRRFPLSTQCYTPGITSPDGERRLADFSPTPWPGWSFRLEDGIEVEHQLFAAHGAPQVILSWKLKTPAPGVRLVVRPFLSGRDYHALHHENPTFRSEAHVDGDAVTWRPYDGVPGILARSNGAYEHGPLWYRGFLYAEERDRGLDFVEDLVSPGSFTWDLSAGEALWNLEAELDARQSSEIGEKVPKPLVHAVGRVAKSEDRRTKRSFRLLKVLSVLPYGETIESIGINDDWDTRLA